MTAALAMPQQKPDAQRVSTPDLYAGPECDATTFAALRRRAVLHGCKWDPQVGDVETLARFAVIMRSSAWQHLAALAEQLTAEAVAAEQEILQRPQLLQQLGLPRSLRQALTTDAEPTPAAGRVVRHDFHPTTEGWKISEANSDVPGGFSEASFFSRMMAEQNPDLRLAGDTASAWANSLAATAGANGIIALLTAPGYMEDHQVTAFLAARLQERGCRTFLAKPQQIVWRNGIAHLEAAAYRGRVNVVVRFYQAEWLARLPEYCGWLHFFRGGRTPVANPGCAVISESKRFPLVWDLLSTHLPTWRRLLPETRDPRRAPWAKDNGWLLKTALCNTGDAVCVRELMEPRAWLWSQWAARMNPCIWIAQRRFASVPIMTPLGPRHVCLGIYTVNGRAAGAYARLAAKPVVDFAAVDAALLLDDHDDE